MEFYRILIHVMSLKEKSGRFFFHFREIFEKCIEFIGKFLIHFREIFNFCKKSGTFLKIFSKFYRSFPRASLHSERINSLHSHDAFTVLLYHHKASVHTYELAYKKTNHLGFRPGPTQTSL